MDYIEYSVSPAGETFPLPKPEDYAREFERVKQLAEQARQAGKEIVVVMGVGFVGAVMAAIVADTRNSKGNCTKFVIASASEYAQLLENSFVKSRNFARKAEDPEVDVLIQRCVNEEKTLTATYNSDCPRLPIASS